MRTQQPWTDYEYGFIQDHDEWPAWRIADELGRTERQIHWKRGQIRKGHEPKREGHLPWSKADDDFILANPYWKASDIGARLGRTGHAIDWRRHELKKQGVTSGRFGGNFSGSGISVGARPLIAKTCPDCGLLLPTKWFNWNAKGGSWSRRCGRCKEVGRAPSPLTEKDKVRNAKTAAKWQELSLATATESGKPWVEAEVAILENPDMTLFQKALALHRSYFAVKSACSARGLTSTQDGLGCPLHDQWIIDNPNAKEHSA